MLIVYVYKPGYCAYNTKSVSTEKCPRYTSY